MIGNLRVQSPEFRVQSPEFRVQSLREDQRPKTKDQRPKKQSGFSLLELMIAMFIIIILLSVALPTYQRSVQNARETVLKQNLDTMRRAIGQYGTDKGKLPQSIDDLVTGEYLRERPVDPITYKTEWKEIQGEDANSVDGNQGLKDVKSTAEGEDSEGVKYQDY